MIQCKSIYHDFLLETEPDLQEKRRTAKEDAEATEQGLKAKLKQAIAEVSKAEMPC